MIATNHILYIVNKKSKKIKKKSKHHQPEVFESNLRLFILSAGDSIHGDLSPNLKLTIKDSKSIENYDNQLSHPGQKPSTFEKYLIMP